MKKSIFSFLTVSVIIVACNNQGETKKADMEATAAVSTLKLPYEPAYSASFNNNVSDSDLLMILNSYKYWESGDLKALRTTMGDSISVDGSDGFKFHGLSDSLMPKWVVSRDSLSSVKITMDVWLKNHELKDGNDYVNVWYKEIDTYKTGKVDSANFSDVNMIKKGKLVWYSSYRQKLKP